MPIGLAEDEEVEIVEKVLVFLLRRKEIKVVFNFFILSFSSGAPRWCCKFKSLSQSDFEGGQANS